MRTSSLPKLVVASLRQLTSRKFAVTFGALAILLAAFSTPTFAQFQIGSGNTAFIEAPIPHPKTTPCVVELFRDFRFANFNAQNFSYAPPADCPAPWGAVILSANFGITEGIQFDRTANIWIGPTNVYFGTTAEDQPKEGRHWHVERSLIDYSSIFTTNQVGTVDLGNLVGKPYTGVLYGSAKVLFYPVATGTTAPRVPDQVIAFSGGADGGTVALDTTGTCCQPSLSQTLTFPTNIEQIFFDVFAQSQHDDEFWYTCVPDSYATELQSCPNSAFRESEVTIDGNPAGVAPVYPWIFTGGIDPYLWIPIPGLQTMNFRPYRVNLTPFAGLLNDGNPHTVALSVFNADDYFSATASLLLYLDADGTQDDGAVTTNTLTAPNPTIKTKINTSAKGNISGTIDTSNGHNFEISGYVNTSHGPVTTTIQQVINFSNDQDFKISDTEYVQDINQKSTVRSVATVDNSSGKTVTDVSYNFPLVLDIVAQVLSSGDETDTTTSNQYYEIDESAKHNGAATNFTIVQNRVTTTDTLNFNSSRVFTGNSGQASAQTLFDSDSTGYCFSQSITGANNVLTGVTSGKGCN